MRMPERSAFPRAGPAQVPQDFPRHAVESVWRWVCPQQIELDVDVRNKREALAAIAALCANSYDLPAAPLLRALWRREQAGSTALGHGVAIPHARIDRIEHPLTSFVRTRTPIAFGATDGQLVSHLYVILVPMHSDYDYEAHLKLLASIAKMFSEPELRVRITTASTSAIAHSIFADWVVQHKNDPGH